VQLWALWRYFRADEFDAISFSQRVLSSIPAYEKDVRKRFCVKRISNDLNRLYKMSFLKRRRIKRKVTTQSGRACHRGFCYEYRISKQGLKYLDYLKRPKRISPANVRESQKQLLQQMYKNDPTRQELLPLYYDYLFPAPPPSAHAIFWQKGRMRPQETAAGKTRIEALQGPIAESERLEDITNELAKYLQFSGAPYKRRY